MSGQGDDDEKAVDVSVPDDVGEIEGRMMEKVFGKSKFTGNTVSSGTSKQKDDGFVGVDKGMREYMAIMLPL
jgi:hypothetical protein